MRSILSGLWQDSLEGNKRENFEKKYGANLTVAGEKEAQLGLKKNLFKAFIAITINNVYVIRSNPIMFWESMNSERLDQKRK